MKTPAHSPFIDALWVPLAMLAGAGVYWGVNGYIDPKAFVVAAVTYLVSVPLFSLRLKRRSAKV